MEQSWIERHKTAIKLAVIGFVTLFTAIALRIWYTWDRPLVSPLSDLPIFRFLQKTDFSTGDKKVVYGFLPYWNLDDVALQPELTNLAYFSLTINADGSLQTTLNGGGEPGFNKLSSDTLLDLSSTFIKRGGTVELVLSQFYASDIDAFLASDKAQQKLLDSLDSVILSYPISGINVDMEYVGTPATRTREQFTQFMIRLREHLNTRYNNIKLSTDVYASAANTPNLWDIEAIAPHLDYIVIMAYDFHRRSSPQAGPVAPLFGGNKLWDSDINTHLREFVKIVPPQKLLLGVPFYGYEWQTTTRDSQSHTFPDSGSTASFKRVLELLTRKDELKVQEHWNEEALSPYLSYQEDGEIYVIYYENSRSISYKLDYVNQLNLGGIAIWALGYEGDSRELWDVISRKLHQ